ncbi:uncharacterized protein EV422DRAFT_280659 [Fimicolochytrium jonesii]|uniref:uncharacterized protein n=1 Tax=Fimicolochytrium jonesii TaxID=1396493 RepID=UPI0022FDFE9B|nr:uncharacterized protein EV422DRAFT_280659 [Fimicolochytrium jonesii]KAI8816612.1 hypothetical protein EV422DRAFT_280659 [Fimicolochytrium jonesii]
MAQNKLCTGEDRFERTFNAVSRLYVSAHEEISKLLKEEWENIGLESLFFTQGTLSTVVPFEVVRSTLFKTSTRIDDVERVWMQMGSIKLKDIAKIRECLAKNHPEPTPPVRTPALLPALLRFCSFCIIAKMTFKFENESQRHKYRWKVEWGDA